LLELKEKKILITGASSGIGRQISIMASMLGAEVTIIGRSEEKLKETLSLLNPGQNHRYKIVDLSDYSAIENFVNSCPYSFNGLVFNAGVVEYLPIKFLNEDKINSVFSTNFYSNVILIQKLLKKKSIAKGGSLVFISSISSKLGVPATAMYSASKASLSAFARVLASELAPQKIRVNSVSPGIILTPMTNSVGAAITEEEMQKASYYYPLGYGETEDVAGLVMYLLSDISKWMTGSDITIDGGYNLK
jgi:NAD(P)-dependent dehydrogenase (short-subunit alcohol dehydrogenase family)